MGVGIAVVAIGCWKPEVAMDDTASTEDSEQAQENDGEKKRSDSDISNVKSDVEGTVVSDVSGGIEGYRRRAPSSLSLNSIKRQDRTETHGTTTSWEAAVVSPFG